MTRNSTMIRRITATALAGLLLAGVVLTTSAHETREVEGEFEFVVGFMNEPAYVNQMNGIDLRINRIGGDAESHNDDNHNDDAHDDDQHANGDHDHGSGEPVEGAHETLNATIIFGDQSMDVDLRPVWGQPGAYTADVMPTETGTYSFQFAGEIDGVQIDETFQGGPDTFSEVNSTDELNFPSSDASGGGDAGETDQATAIAIAGVVAGLLGLAVGGAALYKVTNSGEPNPAQQRREQRRAQQKQSDEQG
jgi:hypothetical protein